MYSLQAVPLIFTLVIVQGWYIAYDNEYKKACDSHQVITPRACARGKVIEFVFPSFTFFLSFSRKKKFEMA